MDRERTNWDFSPDFCHVKLTQSTALELTCDQAFFILKQKGKKNTWPQVTLEQERLDFRSLSSALHNLWLLIVYSFKETFNDQILVFYFFFVVQSTLYEIDPCLSLIPLFDSL